MKKCKMILGILMVLALSLSACGTTEQAAESESESLQNLPVVVTEAATEEIPDSNGFAGAGEIVLPVARTEAETEVPETETPETAAEVSFADADETVYTTSELNLRTVPSTTAEDSVAEVVPKRTKLKRTGISEKWSRVEYEGQILYASADYLSTEEPAVSSGGLICIDAGHQAHQNNDTEPLGPGSSEMKKKVSSGTEGVVSGLNEYELNLMVAKKLQAELEDRGYSVLMIRTGHDIDMSNAERAQVANDAGADVFVRIHADGEENHDLQGMMTICPTSSNPYYAGDVYSESYALSEAILDGMVDATGAKRRFVWETDTMTGINWSKVPVSIVEMGFMSNPEEDELMATDSYQQKIAEGIANGIDRYMANR